MKNTGRSAARSRAIRIACTGLGCLCAAITALQPASSFAQELGRLFYTPQERQELDRRRQNDVVEPDAVVENLVTVNGQVTRSSGKTTTWINGVPQDDAHRGRDPARVAVDGGPSRVPIKVGQTLDRSSGQVSDTLQGGKIRIREGNP
jgi:hypothetical protein